MAAREVLFREYAEGHRMSFFGEVSPKLSELANKYGAELSVFSYLMGLEAPVAV